MRSANTHLAWYLKLQVIFRKRATSYSELQIHSVGDVPIHTSHVGVFEVQPIAFRVSFNLNLQSRSLWSLFNGTWSKRRKDPDHWVRFENEEMTLQMQYAAHRRIHIACVVIADLICDYNTRDVYVCSVLHLECHFFILKSSSFSNVRLQHTRCVYVYVKRFR